jgi:general secretion pathway protein K
MITNSSAAPTWRPSSDGFVLVAVLLLLGALATLVSIYAVYVINTASGFTVHEDRLQSEALVSAALELTAYQLSPTANAPPPTHGSFDFRLGKANISVSFESEAARIDLNAAPKELLAGLFASLGVAPDSAAQYANRVAAWRSRPSDDQGRAPPTQTADPNNPPPPRFFDVDELSVVPDLPTDLVERCLPFITVYSGRPQVDILEAAPKVLAALPGMTKDTLAAVLAHRQMAGDGQALLQLLGPAQNFASIKGSKASRVTVRIDFDNGRRARSEVIILPFDDGAEPYSILSWHDRLEADDKPATASL